MSFPKYSYLVEDVDGWTALHWAIVGRNNETAEMLLKQETDLHQNNPRLEKTLMLAAETGMTNIVDGLLLHGVAFDCVDSQGSTPLHWAVASGHEEVSRSLLAYTADPDWKDKYGNTSLHWSVSNCAIARLLVNSGANPKAQNSTGQSVLIWACLARQVDVVRLLLEAGADVTAADDYGFTALHAAAARGDSVIAQLLLDGNAETNTLDQDGWTPLHVAAFTGKVDAVRLLEHQTQDGHEMAAWVAAQLASADVCSLLLEMAARKSVGSTVVSGLQSAINSGHNLHLRALLDDGAAVNAIPDVGGATALCHACWLGRQDVAELLLDRGAAVNLRDGSGRTALHWASEAGYADLVSLLLRRGAVLDLTIFGWTPMLLAARTWQPHVIANLVRAGADVNVRDFHGRSILHWSSKHGHTGLVDVLIRSGANVDAQDHCGQSVLHWAAANGQAAVVAILLGCGAKNNVQALDGHTPLHLVAYTGHTEIAGMLLGRARRRDRIRGSRVRAREARSAAAEANGYTALDFAELTGNHDVAHLISRARNQHPGSHAPQNGYERQDPQSRPLLDLNDGQENDYPKMPGGIKLGRPIITPEIYRWLRSRARA